MPDPSADELVLELVGDIDIARAGEITTRGDALLRSAVAGQRLVIDLGRVTFIDSSGLSSLLRLRRAAVERDVTVTLRDVPADVAVLLRLSGIDQVLPTE